MRLLLSIEKQAFVRNEPVVVKIHFVNGDALVAFPFEHSALDLTTFQLAGAAGELWAKANGYTREERLGLDPAPGHARSLKTEPLAGGDDVSWSDDLLGYFGPLEPGVYKVSVRFVFAPSGIAEESEMVEFRVDPLHCAEMDVLADTVATTVVHSVEQHLDDGGRRRALFHFRSGREPMTAWSGVAIGDVPDCQPYISEADFVSRVSFAHDFSRWIAWLAGSRLTLALVEENEPVRRFHHELPLLNGTMVGRPAQHQDGGVSILGLDTGGELRRFRFDAAGSLTGSGRTGVAGTGAITAGFDRAGRLFVMRAEPDAVVLETEERGELIELGRFELPQPDRARLLRMRLDCKPRTGGGAAMVLCCFEEGGLLRLIAGIVLFEGGHPGPMRWRRHAVDLRSESVTGGDLLVDGDELTIAVSMSSGRIVFASAEVARSEGPGLLAGSLALVRTAVGVRAFFADSSLGMQCSAGRGEL